jgi:hypothetical protein
LEGSTEDVKEYQIGVDVLGRPPSFDPTEDAAARVEAHRLRKRLREYYETEGQTHSLRIEVPLGHYAITFQRAAAQVPQDGKEEATEEHSPNGSSTVAEAAPLDSKPKKAHPWYRIALWCLGAILVAIGFLALKGVSVTKIVAGPPPKLPIAVSAAIAKTEAVPAPVLAPQTPVRIGCGRTKSQTDRWGEVWDGDRYFEGGEPFETSRRYIARAYDPKLFQTGRMGNFTYKIPLSGGPYELHLYFMEDTYGPAMPAGGGEISRIFDVRANGKPLLSRFDIYSDAGGANIADVRVFKDVFPGPDNALTLSFQGQTGQAVVNAIELVPAAVPHRLNPVRILAQDGFYTDSNGVLWKPDRYYSGGQIAFHSVELRGTNDPEIYTRERYGHFDYAIPVDKGTYRLSLYFAEEYFVPHGQHAAGPGQRIFDVTCNGVALLRDFDLLKEGGPAQAIVKTFHGLTPNGQGKLLVSFSPVHDYASLYALEMVDESN